MLLLFAANGAAFAQPAATAKGTATVAGVVKVGDRAAAGVTVMLMPERQARPQPMEVQSAGGSSLRAVTDAGGNYRFVNVSAGRYRVMPLTEVYIVSAVGAEAAGGANVTVEEGQSVSQVDFTLTRGGVITGRVTDQEGRPVVAERIGLTTVDANGQPQQLGGGSRFGYETDDRGVYRAYGLPAGRYLVSAGSDRGGPPMAGRRVRYALTYHPDAADQSQAQAVEVAAGGVSESVDIRLSGPLKTYAVAGRTVDADTGQPVALVPVSAGRGRGVAGGFPGGSGGVSNANGEFQITGLTPGRYSVSVSRAAPMPGMGPGMPTALGTGAEAVNDYYSEPVSFEIAGDDVTGVEVRVRRGASIFGVVVVEGANAPALAARLSQLMVSATSRGAGAGGQAPRGGAGRTFSPVGADGSFRLSGLAPGQVSLSVNSFGGGFGGGGSFSLARVERNGAALPGAIEVAAGEQVAGVRLVVSYGTGVIRGRVSVVGGALTGGLRLIVTARPLNSAGQSRFAEVDATGQFRIDGLTAGGYEVRLMTAGNSLGPGARPQESGGGVRVGRGPGAGQGGGQPAASTSQPRTPRATQTVSVNNGAESQVVLTLDLSQQ
jgi:hypothetical protein